MEDYIEQALRTESYDLESIANRLTTPWVIRLNHVADGLCTEAGEFKDAMKKYVYYGKNLDSVNLMEEIGDIFWYLAIACDQLGIDFNYVQEQNIAKLKARYPEKFNSENALNRNLEVERQVLEND